MLNERFTLWLNAEGQPVDKPLSEMTSGELLQALHYHDDEHQRLDALCEPDRPLYELAQGGEPAPPEISREQIQAAAARSRAAAAAADKLADLLQLIGAAIPQWRRHPGMKLTLAVKQFWPR